LFFVLLFYHIIPSLFLFVLVLNLSLSTYAFPPSRYSLCIMGSAQSVPVPQATHRAASTRQRRVVSSSTEDSFDEKFDALKINSPTRKNVERVIFSSDDPENVDAAATEEFAHRLLKDPRNRLGYAALSGSNPKTVLQRPSVPVRDQQTFNVTIPHEGTPVSRSFGYDTWRI
jgi:bleomycin hydrolase